MQILRNYQYLKGIFLVKKIYMYFNSFLYGDFKVKPLHMILPKASAYVENFDGQTKWMYFSSEDDDLLEKFKTIWDKLSGDLKKNFGKPK